MQNTEPSILIKIILVGDVSSGKTCFLNRVINNEFKNTESTVGFQNNYKNYDINNTKAKVEFCDTAGQQKFRTLQRIYFRNTHISIICYNMNNPESILNLEYWMKEVENYCPEGVKIVLLGCMNDLQIRTPIPQDIKDKFPSKKIFNFSVSAKTGSGIQQMMKQILTQCVNQNNFQFLSVIKKSSTINNKSSSEQNNVGNKCC